MPISLNYWNSYVIFPKLQSYHCLLSICSYKSTPTQTLFGPGRSGAPLGYTTIIMLNDYLPVLFTYGGIPSYPTNVIVCSFVLLYVSLL